MNCLSTAVNDIRLGRKRFSISGSLLPLVLLSVALLLVTHTSARPANETATSTATTSQRSDSIASSQQQQQQPKNSDAIYNYDSNMDGITFDGADEYGDVDNVEWHHVKIVDGIMHEDHPIIMYKEDFVSEDYDPTQQHNSKKNSNEDTTTSTATTTTYPRRKYKNIKRHHQQQQRLNQTTEQIATDTSGGVVTEKYHALKPEKIFFDILPQAPVVVNDDSSSNDSKFDASRIHVEVISLLDEKNAGEKATAIEEENEEVEETPSKQLLNKRPKKYHHQHHRRMRRGITAAVNNEHADHVVHKRTPHYTYERYGPNSFDDYAKHLMNYWVQNTIKHPVAGNRWNGIDGDVPPAIEFGNRFGDENNTDRVVWGVSKARPRPTKRPTTQRPAFPPLIHNSNPDEADFSMFTTRRPQNSFNNNNFNNNNNNRRPTQNRPQSTNQVQLPPLFHNSNPNDADFSGFTRPPPTISRTTTRAPFLQSSPSQNNNNNNNNNNVATGGSTNGGGGASISQCVWAIVNCCSTSNTNIRYECFERLGCRGAFWNLNPCAENIKDSVLDFVDQQFQ